MDIARAGASDITRRREPDDGTTLVLPERLIKAKRKAIHAL